MFTIGCDPELMIIDKKSKELRSAIPIIPGSKHNPHPVKGGAILSDNVNLEFNTMPAKSAKEFIKSMKVVLVESVKIIGKDYKLVVKASSNFPASELKDRRAQEFGCEPDFDAWKLEVNKVDAGSASKAFRSAGGHIHIGMTSKTKFLNDPMGKVLMTKAMDIFTGIPSIFLDKDPTSKDRRSLYGKAGCHRPKEYGVEYRALGNFWVESPELVTLMYDLTAFAVKFCLKEKDVHDLISRIGEEVIIDTINKCDTKRAEEIYNTHIVPLLPKALVAQVKKLDKKTFEFYNSWKLKE